jgi:predicted double-glycine peptidase
MAFGAAGVSAAGMDLAAVDGANFRLHVTSLKEARFKTTLRQQYDFSCGSAAVATLLTHHYNYPITEQLAFEQMYAQGDQNKIRKEGFSLLDIKRFLAHHGFDADGFQLPLEKLVETGYPAIVLLVDKGYNHFVVIKGIEEGRVLIGDPAGGTRAISRSSFDAMWPSKLLFVIHDKPGLIKFNAAADWRVAPRAPLQAGVDRNGLNAVAMPKNGPGQF